MEWLVRCTVRAAMAGDIDARTAANVAHGSACSARGDLLGVQVQVLARAAEWRMSEFKPQELGNTAWAVAVVKQSDEKLFLMLSGAAERRVSEFKP